jgi:hypothetical protein
LCGLSAREERSCTQRRRCDEELRRFMAHPFMGLLPVSIVQ